MKIEEGQVVITKDTGQAGTICSVAGQIMVLLQNKDIWYGESKMLREPQDRADLDAAAIDHDRFKNRPKPAPRDDT